MNILTDVWWFDVKPHRWWQRHKAVTKAYDGTMYIERCSCGAFGPKPWMMLKPDKRRTVRKWRKEQRATTP